MSDLSTIEEVPVNIHTDTPMLPLPKEIFNHATCENGLNWTRLLNAAQDLRQSEFASVRLLLSGLEIDATLFKIQNGIEVRLAGFVDDADIWDVLEDLKLAIKNANTTLPRAIFQVG